MAGRGHSWRFSVSGLLEEGDLINLDQPAESMLLKEDGFLMDSDLDTEIFKASPPKPSVEAPLQVYKKDESSVETKPKRRRNKMRSSMAWDEAFQVDEDALFLRDPSDPPLAPEPPAPPRTRKHPTSIDIPARKSFQDAQTRPPLRARTPDPTPFAELQSNTPIPDAEPSPVAQQQSGGKRRKEAVQESMAWNRAFQEENQGALLTDDLPLAESPVLPTRRKSPRTGMDLQESSDSCTTSVGCSRENVNRSSMAWDRAFRSGEGVLEMDTVEQSSKAPVARSSDQAPQSVFSSVESLRTEASTSSLAWTAPEDEAESGARKGARLQNSLEGGLVGHVLEKTSTPVRGTPTKGERRRKLAGLHRPTSTAVAIEAAIQHGTRLRLPGRYNPNPVPPPRSKPKTPEPALRPSDKSPLPGKSPKSKLAAIGGSTSKESVEADRSTKLADAAVKKSLETKESLAAKKSGLSAGKPGFEQVMGPQEVSRFEALQAQLAATERERDALKAKLEASTGALTSPTEFPASHRQTSGEDMNRDGGDLETPGRTSERNGGTQAAAEAGGPVEVHAASGLRRPQMRSTTGTLPRGSIPHSAGSAQIRARGSLKDSLAAASGNGNGNGNVRAEEAAPGVPAPGVRPSFLRKPSAKRDFFHAPTGAAPQSPARKSAVGPAPVASPARHSRASAGAGSGAHSMTEALKVPSVRRGVVTEAAGGARAPVPASAKPSQKPQNSETSQTSQSSLPRYQSLLRNPSAPGETGNGQSRTLKPGAFSGSAIQAACAVPLPSSPAGKLDVASQSPAKKPGARSLLGFSSPAASRLRRSADKPVAAPNSGETTRTPQKGANTTNTPPQVDPPVANAFLSKLAAASGGLSRIPSLGMSRLKPPGAKVPGVTSALPRPSFIDPALVAAACAAPLPGSPKPSKPEPLLPRGISGALKAPRGAPHSSSAAVSKLPVPPGRSLLRPPCGATAALVRAACAVPLPLSPGKAKSGPVPSPSEESPKTDTILESAAGTCTERKKGRAGTKERRAVDEGLEGEESQNADVMEDGATGVVTNAESGGPVTAKDSCSSSVDKRSAPPTGAEDTCPSSKPSVGTPAPARCSPTVAPETNPESLIPCSVNQAPELSSPARESEASRPSKASDDEPAASVSYPSLQLPPDSCPHTRRLSKKPNLPTIYSPARSLFTPEGPEGDREGGNGRPWSPVARALFASKLGKAARVNTEVEDEGSVPAGVEGGTPVTLNDGIPAGVEDGNPVSLSDGVPAGAVGDISVDLGEVSQVGLESSDPYDTKSGNPVCQAGGMAIGTEDGLEGRGFEKGETREKEKDEVEKKLSPENLPGNEEALGEDTEPDSNPMTEPQNSSRGAIEPSVTELEQRQTEQCPGERIELLADSETEPQSYPGDTDQPSVTQLVERPVGITGQVEQPGVCSSAAAIPAPLGEAVSCNGEPAGAGQGITEEAITVSESTEGSAFDQKAGPSSGGNVSHPQKLAVSNRQELNVSDQEFTAGGSSSAPEVPAVPVPVPGLRPLSDGVPTLGSPSHGLATFCELRPDQGASIVPDQEMPVLPNDRLPAVPGLEIPVDSDRGVPAGASHEIPGVSEAGTPTAKAEEPTEPEGIPPPGEAPVPAAASGGIPGFFARLRARQAAVAALLDSPVKTQTSPDSEGIVEGRLERPVDTFGEQLKQLGVQAEMGLKPRGESGDTEKEAGVQPGTEAERAEGEASDRGKQPGLELERKEEEPGVQPGQEDQRPGSGPEEKEQPGDQAGENETEARSQPGNGSPSRNGSYDAEKFADGPDRAEGAETETGADGGLHNEVVSLPLTGADTNALECADVDSATKEPGNMVTVLKVREEKEFGPVPSPGVKSPVSAAWEEAWFGTPVGKPGGTNRGPGLGTMCLTKEKEQSPGDEAEGKETGGKTQSTVDEDAASVFTEPDVSTRHDEVCNGGDDASSSAVDGMQSGVSAWGVDGAPEAQSGDARLTEALSAGGFTPRVSLARSGRGSGRKPSPKTPSPILSLAIPAFLSPMQTPIDEPRQTLESQFDDQAGRDEMDAQWDACVARFGGRKRTSPASLPRGPPGRRTPTRHSAEDLWSYLAPGRRGSPRVTPTRGASPVSVLTRTPGRLKHPLSESAPGLASLMQSVMDASARKEEKLGAFGASSSPGARPRGRASGKKKPPALSPVDVSWDGEDLDARIRAIEAAGEGALATKSGRVQASPPDKKEEVPANPYSPVKKKECGPFDCTKKSASF